MSKFSILQDGSHCADFPDFDAASCLAQGLLRAVAPTQPTTFSIVDADDRLHASITNRRIVGTFLRQTWGGRKGDDAISCGCEEFDATDAVLLMDHVELMALADGAESSDELGRAHVQWVGPCEVSVVESVCQYFGVDALEDVTPEALAFARRLVSPQPTIEQTITLSIKTRVRTVPGADLNAFIENLEYSVVSQTAGVVVIDTELVDA